MKNNSSPKILIEEEEPDMQLEQADQQQQSLPSVDEILGHFYKMRCDPIDIAVLKRFYITGKPYPMDTAAYVGMCLYMELVQKFNFNSSYPAFYEKLEKMVRRGLITKIRRTNPGTYEPVEELRFVVRKAIVMWLAKHGLSLL